MHRSSVGVCLLSGQISIEFAHSLACVKSIVGNEQTVV
jgi:hypothetical protein